MSYERGRVAPIYYFLLLTGAVAQGQPFTVATVGDSFADSLYNSLRSRPDLVRQHGIQLLRWSRPIVGLTRGDFFDYPTWLHDSADLGKADLCFVEIGANDMQSMPAANQQWIAYGSPAWKEAYGGRTVQMARTLAEQRCGQVLWVLQPGFERRDAMACHRELINEVQREAVRLDRTRVLEIATNEAAYMKDKTHFNRAYLLQLGPAMFQLVDTARQIAHGQCLTCHRNVNVSPPDGEMLPLRWSRTDSGEAIWVPDHTGVQCRIAVERRIRSREAAPHGRSKRRLKGRRHKPVHN
jgi:hypothetical protein